MPDQLTIEAELAAYYDHEAEDRERRPLSEQRLEARNRFLAEIDMSLPVLEVGTGTGRDVKEFVAADLSVVGIDLSFEQGHRAQAAGAHQVIASARSLPFRDYCFSTFWSMSTLMHVPNGAIRETLVEVRRVLTPGAVAGIGVWGGPDTEDYGAFKGRLGHRRLFSRRSDETWRRLLRLVGDPLIYETWNDDGDDFWYQFALLRVPL